MQNQTTRNGKEGKERSRDTVFARAKTVYLERTIDFFRVLMFIDGWHIFHANYESTTVE
jgi:hypothetical protein